MREILPGLHHWTTWHDGIAADVSSHYVEPAGVLIDPPVPEEGIEAALGGLAAPQQVGLTTGLHARHAARFAEHYGIPIRASREADERRGGDPPVTFYRDGEEVGPGVRAIEIGKLAPDEY